jgi:hypothetical protein
MVDDIFSIGAEGVNVDDLVEQIRQTVRTKAEQGAYVDTRVARAEKTNLANLAGADEFLEFYLECLREAAPVDFSDFEIRERRRGLSFLLVPFKRLIWKLLKFYTYRLWSQQNETNALLVSAVEASDANCRERIKQLQSRIERLEKRVSADE